MISSANLGAALVMHANPVDIDMVMVNGEVLKRNGKLLRVDWDTLKLRLRENRKELELRWKGIDWRKNRADLVSLWGLESVLV